MFSRAAYCQDSARVPRTSGVINAGMPAASDDLLPGNQPNFLRVRFMTSADGCPSPLCQFRQDNARMRGIRVVMGRKIRCQRCAEPAGLRPLQLATTPPRFFCDFPPLRVQRVHRFERVRVGGWKGNGGRSRRSPYFLERRLASWVVGFAVGARAVQGGLGTVGVGPGYLSTHDKH